MDNWTSELKATAAARGWLATAAVALSTLAERGPAAGRLCQCRVTRWRRGREGSALALPVVSS